MSLNMIFTTITGTDILHNKYLNNILNDHQAEQQVVFFCLSMSEHIPFYPIVLPSRVWVHPTRQKLKLFPFPPIRAHHHNSFNHSDTR